MAIANGWEGARMGWEYAPHDSDMRTIVLTYQHEHGHTTHLCSCLHMRAMVPEQIGWDVHVQEQG